MPQQQLVLVIGATGAQGLAAGVQRNSPAKGVEVFEGSTDDFSSVLAALQDVYGVFVNTDSFTIGEEKEVFAGIRIFELAKQVPTIKHYVWSNLEYISKLTGYNPEYHCAHYDGKGRVGEFLKLQPSEPTHDGFSWSQLSTCPYMDMLKIMTFGPLNKRADGTVVFATPIGAGKVPMIALSDLGFFARYIFDHRVETSGKDLQVTSDMVGWDYLANTFQRVTGQKAVVVYQSIEEWNNNFNNVDLPLASDHKGPITPDTMTWRKNFTAWWKIYRDGILHRDMEWIRKVNPNGHTLESWMRESNYMGVYEPQTLKGVEDGKSISPRQEIVTKL
ncbi:hypothetical protein QCA50_005645 [Cerrena zonata]|uniref:NmrA-like domain-containing protein n=1 Tax=Cerrena zonata TaxID=2478898 RepID=A0AAW0GDM8_9APHY